MLNLQGISQTDLLSRMPGLPWLTWRSFHLDSPLTSCKNQHKPLLFPKINGKVIVSKTSWLISKIFTIVHILSRLSLLLQLYIYFLISIIILWPLSDWIMHQIIALHWLLCIICSKKSMNPSYNWATDFKTWLLLESY